jgi:hypothetical protein
MGARPVARPSWQEEARRFLGPAYFNEGVFARPHRGELFQRHTCVPCGHHSPTWALFRLHRQTCVAPMGEPPEPLIEP